VKKPYMEGVFEVEEAATAEVGDESPGDGGMGM